MKSPINGTVISRPVEVGQVISSTSAFGEGSIIMTMADLSKVRVRALVDEIDVGKVALDPEVLLKLLHIGIKNLSVLYQKLTQSICSTKRYYLSSSY